MRSQYNSLVEAKDKGLLTSNQELFLQDLEQALDDYYYNNSTSKLFAIAQAPLEEGKVISIKPTGFGDVLSSSPQNENISIVEQEQKEGAWWEKNQGFDELVFYTDLIGETSVQSVVSLVGTAHAAANFSPVFNQSKSTPHLITMSNSIFYKGGIGGTRSMNSAKLIESETLMGIAFRGNQEFTRISNGVSKVGSAVSVISVGYDVVDGISENIKNNESQDKIAADLAVDLVVSGGTAVAATIIGSIAAGAVAGSVVPGLGNLVGALAGLAVGVSSYMIFDNKKWHNDKTGRELMQDGLESLIINTKSEPTVSYSELEIKSTFLN